MQETAPNTKVTTVARSRFDKPEPSSPGKADIAVVSAAVGHTNLNTLQLVDPNIDPEKAIQLLKLPQSTLYLIDKVVRAKALQGPIGVDNSEVINLEIEREYKRKNKHLTNDPNEEKDDEEGEDLTLEERENITNAKLLDRLYKAANIEHSAVVRFEGGTKDDQENVIDNQNRTLIS